MGLKDQISAAKTNDEITQLLSGSAAFKEASPKTRRQWDRRAIARAKVLAAPAPAEKRKKKETVENV